MGGAGVLGQPGLPSEILSLNIEPKSLTPNLLKQNKKTPRRTKDLVDNMSVKERGGNMD